MSGCAKPSLLFSGRLSRRTFVNIETGKNSLLQLLNHIQGRTVLINLDCILIPILCKRNASLRVKDTLIWVQ